MEEYCKHKWEEVERRKKTDKYIRPGLFSDGIHSFKTVILQRCIHCGKQDVIEF